MTTSRLQVYVTSSLPGRQVGLQCELSDHDCLALQVTEVLATVTASSPEGSLAVVMQQVMSVLPTIQGPIVKSAVEQQILLTKAVI